MENIINKEEEKINNTNNTILEETLNTNKKENIRKRKPKEPMVEGIFRNLEIPGSPLTFSFSIDKNPAKKYTLIDGEKVTLPLSVAKHINNCKYSVNKAEIDSRGIWIGVHRDEVHRFSFRRIDNLMEDA